MSRHLFNPFMPSIDFASRIARGGGGDSGGGGGDDDGPKLYTPPPEPTGRGLFGLPPDSSPEMQLELPANVQADPKLSYQASQQASKDFGVEYQRAYGVGEDNMGEVSLVQVQRNDDDSQPIPQEDVVVPEPTPEPTPTEPTPEEPVVETPVEEEKVTPSSEESSPLVQPSAETPDPIPEDVSETVVTMQTQAPTYAQPTQIEGQMDELGLTGTTLTRLPSAGLSAVPQTFQTRPNYTGTTMANLSMPSQGQAGIQNVVYKNALGQTVNVTEVNGQPITYVPPGYEPAAEQGNQTIAQFAKGGTVGDSELNGMYRMATKFLGYTGPKTREALAAFRNSSPAVAAKMQRYSNAMAKGGLMRKGYQTGGTVGYQGPQDMPYTEMEIPADMLLPNQPQFDKLGNPYPSQMYGVDNSIQPRMPIDPATGQPYPAQLTTLGQLQTTQPTPLTEQQKQAFYLSPEYQALDQNMSPIGDATDYTSDYFGQFTNPTLGAAQDAAYAAYLRRTQGEEAAQQYTEDLAASQRQSVLQTMQPRQATVAQLVPQAADFIAPTAGQAAPQAPYAEAATVQQAALAQQQAATQAALMQPSTAAGAVQAATAATQAAQGAIAPEAQITAAQQAASAVSGLEAAQGTAIMMDNPVQREIQAGELISGAADAEKAAAFTEQVQAAQATPSKQATVAGQLETLMAQFEGGQTPPWAAGAMRNAVATLSARGLGASSLAGQAVIQATMEAALPIAQADAQTMASFEAQNLSNRQQRAMLAAQQRATFMGMEFDQAFQARVQNSARIGDIANLNFTAEQQVALENARAANTVNLNNLNNRQAIVMAEAAALSQLDMANLNNRQQAAVQNAQNFLQMDLTNLSNEQQTSMFKAQQNIQALFTDQAAENAAAQFNASSENQTNQFFATLANQTAQFNASQTNAIQQYNVNAVNALRQFNSEQQQQRDLFNAQNGLVIAQANAQWRQNLATFNTAAQNESNMQFAQTMNELTAANMDRIWQRERDLMSYAVQTANNNADRANAILLQKLANDAALSEADAQKSAALLEIGGAIARDVVGGFLDDIF